jgi:hypothetical protein
MGIREEIQKRIERKRIEVFEFEARIKEARVYIQALEDTVKMLPKDAPGGTELNLELRPGSRVAKAQDFLRKAGRPQQILAILEGIGEEPNNANRAALSGSIGAYVRKGEIFTRPAPNTFGLVEFGAAPSKKGPPPGFGRDGSEIEQQDLVPTEDVMQFS